MNNLGIYLHIPFCKRKCEYCDFYSVTDLSLIPCYVDKLCEDIEVKSQECTGFSVDTIYFGGGTPSLVECDDLDRILKTVRRFYEISDSAEITVEVNPSSLTEEKAQKYAEFGFTRVSMGMQSACDSELCSLGRLHDITQFDKAYYMLREAGIDNISIDLMYGLPGQSSESLVASIDHILDLSPEHISTYCLKVEEGTAFYKKGVSEADEDVAYEQYELICDILAKYGYEHYEVSNFAKSGYRSRHNCKYWTGEDYLGFGPAAYSFFNRKRYGFGRTLDDYLLGQIDICDEEYVSDSEAVREKIIFGLRMSDGVEVSFLDENKLKNFVDQELMMIRDGRASFTVKGYFVSNAIIYEFLE